MSHNDSATRVYRSFRLSVLISRYPVRIAVWLALMLLFTPDLARFIYGDVGGQAISARIVIWASSLGIFFVLPFLVEFINYKTCPIVLHPDHLDMPGEFFLRETMRVPYRQVDHVEVSASTAQKAHRLLTLHIHLNTVKRKNRGLSFKIEDLPRASELLGRLNHHADISKSGG